MSVAERLPKDYSWRPTTASGRVLGWLLVTFGVLSLFEAAFQLDRAISATALTGTSDDVWFRLVQEAQSSITLATGPVIIACEALWLIWQHAVNADLWARGEHGLRFTPGWSVGWWFVPIASLVQPFRAVRELSRRAGRRGAAGSGEPRVATDGLLSAWWVSYILFGVLRIPAFVILSRDFWPIFRGWWNEAAPTLTSVPASDLRAIAWSFTASGVVGALAALLAARIVWAISRAEDAMLPSLVPPRPDR